MKAVVYDKKYLPLKLRLVDLDQPVPKDNQVLLRVLTASLNAADYRSIQLGIIPKSRILGSAVAGIVEAVGKDVQAFKPGDELIADLSDTGFGGLSEYLVADEKVFTFKPLNVSFEDAAALPVAANTALRALRDKGNLQASQNVLIVGCAGGVGQYALQIAKLLGAHVTGVCSSRNIDQSLDLGADKLIDYSQEDFTKIQKRFDLILAINGNYPLLAYRRLLKSKGMMVMVGGSLSQVFKCLFFGRILSFGGKKMKILSARADAKDLSYVANLLREKRIKAVIHKSYPFEESAQAMEELRKGHARGKIVIRVNQSAVNNS